VRTRAATERAVPVSVTDSSLSPRRLMKALDLDPASDASYNKPMQEEPQHYAANLVD
jgi:hypothetical protein